MWCQVSFIYPCIFLHCASFELLSHLWDFSNFQYLLLIGHSRPDGFKVFHIRVKVNVHIPNKSNALVQFSACSTVPMCLPVRTANSCLYCHQTYHLYLCSFLEFKILYSSVRLQRFQDLHVCCTWDIEAWLVLPLMAFSVVLNNN